MAQPHFPDTTEHLAIAGRTGTGKTVAALDMLSRRLEIPWIVIDHKRDSSIKRLSLPDMSLTPKLLPVEGLHHVKPAMTAIDKQKLETLLERVFKKGSIGVYVDEGHLMGMSDAIRNIMVAGRDRHVPMMWISQRATFIDPFIWSQSSFYRVFRLQTKNDIKRFEENFPSRWTDPANYHSHYYDGRDGRQYYLGPCGPLEDSINRIDARFRKSYGRV